MHNRAHITSLLAALAFCAVASAQAPVQESKPASPELPKLDFSKVDKDANGRLSKEEARSVPELEAAFKVLDTDHDGSITPVEFSHWSRAGKAEMAPRDPATAPSGSAGSQHMSPPT
jgi:hypothetical protein